MRKFCTGLVLACLTGAVLAGPRGAVVRVEGDMVTVNRGQQDQVKAGDRWYVYHNGQPAAELQVEQVGEFSSMARVTRRVGEGALTPGDIVTVQGTAPGQPGIPETGGPPGQGGPPIATTLPGNYTTSTVTSPGMARPPRTTDLQELEKIYKNRFDSRTKDQEFRQVAGAPRAYEQLYPGTDLMGVYSTVDLVVSSFGPGGFYGDPARLLMTGASMFYANQARDRLYDSVDAHVNIQVTYWDESLMEAYADYVAVSEAKGNTERMVQLKNSMYAQKGVNQARVCEVRIRNIGKVNAQLNPFHWHIFMAGPGGSMIKPDRYDRVLDRQLSPGQEVNGNVFFPNAETQQGKFTILLEDIFGDKGQLEFDTSSRD